MGLRKSPTCQTVFWANFHGQIFVWRQGALGPGGPWLAAELLRLWADTHSYRPGEGVGVLDREVGFLDSDIGFLDWEVRFLEWDVVSLG